MFYYVPIIVIVAANTLYNLSAKGMPSEGNVFFYLICTYTTAALLCVALFITTGDNTSIADEVKTLNFVPFLFGGALVALEYGFILLYKLGWEISIGATLCNILLAVVLLIVGILFFKEHISVYQIIGILLCGAGLFFINKH